MLPYCISEASCRDLAQTRSDDARFQDLLFSIRLLFASLLKSIISELTLQHPHRLIQILIQQTSCQVYRETIESKGYSDVNHALNLLLYADSTSIAPVRFDPLF